MYNSASYSLHGRCQLAPPQRFLVSVVVGLEGPRLAEPHVLGLVVGQLGEVRVEGGEVERGHELVHQLGHQVHVRLVPARRGVEQL